VPEAMMALVAFGVGREWLWQDRLHVQKLPPKLAA